SRLGALLSRPCAFGAWAPPQGWHCILPCQPDAHPTVYERLALWQANDAMVEREGRCWHGRFTDVTMDRDLHDVLRRGGDEALSVHGVESTVGQANPGAPRYPNSFSTHHRLSADHSVAVAQAGRGRGKIENAKNTVLKPQGYHLEHHFGHGPPSLSALLLSLHLRALLFHTVWAWSDDTYALLRRVLARRQTFFEDIRALTRYMVFESWDHLMDVMIRGLALQPQVDTG